MRNARSSKQHGPLKPVPPTPEELAAQDTARAEVARGVRWFSIPTREHFEPEPDDERTLYVNCRLASAAVDRQVVYAVLEDQGWHPDSKRLSTYRGNLDTMRLVHSETRARLCVVIRIPTGETLQPEAA